jgi:hypothetical protein
MPSGDSIGEPGWDGVSNTAAGSAWVPRGPARWEMGCSAKPQPKANEDFAKRTFLSRVEEMTGAVFVFVTPMRWRQRHVWRELAQQTAPWLDVRVIDADDLEAWLESTPAVMLWFGELLGLSGAGIESVHFFWERWRVQSKLPLSAAALLANRDSESSRFDGLLHQRPPTVAVRADSKDEALAFACARLIATGRAGGAACVTTAEGWRFVDANPGIHIGLACSVEAAVARAPKDGFTLFVPLSKSDREDGVRGVARDAPESESIAVVLDRPDIAAFEEELRKLGEEESDAARLARTAGRSWSVYRRISAKNPAIRHPLWLKSHTSQALSTLTLVGSWNSGKAGDRSCLEAISQRPYERLEADLLGLLGIDDSPVVRIGAVWRAKSTLELLYLCAPQITSGELKRFFEVAELVLAKPDPALELNEDQRWMASVYGKVREESGIVIEAVADSLVRLSVYAETRPAENADEILRGVSTLTRKLLHDASPERWLSLAGVLPQVAEAAPEEFLSASELSLRRADAPIRRLITETAGNSMFGRCWHAGLLWALEVLAWSPSRLHRVAGVLAQLQATPVPGNWANTPMSSLASLLRPWWPQTMANGHSRLAILDRLFKDHNETAWTLLANILPTGPLMATANAAPRWRDDDAGKARLLGTFDPGYLSELGAKAIAQAAGHPHRVAALLRKIDSFEGAYKDSIIRLVEAAASFDDDGRLLVRDSLCKYLAPHNLHKADGEAKIRAAAERLRPYFDSLAPSDPVKSSLWLFASSWVTLPDGRESDYDEYQAHLGRERSQAFAAVMREQGWEGVALLASRAGDPFLVGLEIARAMLPQDSIVQWVVDQHALPGWAAIGRVLSGLLRGLTDERRATFVELTSARLFSKGYGASVVELLAKAPFVGSTWAALDRLDESAKCSYWSTVVPGFCQLGRADSVMAVDRLMQAGRARTAYQVICHDPGAVEPTVLKVLLDAIREGAEPEGFLLESSHLEVAIRTLKAAGTATRRELAVLEFSFFRALQHTASGTKHLYAELLSEPVTFMEIVSLLHKPPREGVELTGGPPNAAIETAWLVLNEGRGIPGTRDDGGFDETAFSSWIQEVRRLAAGSGLLKEADRTIGGWLSECKPEANGFWPPAALSGLLDQADCDEMREGFGEGLRNNRGMTTRAYAEGGAQERLLATHFRERAQAVSDRFPLLAELFRSLARRYESDARREDNSANLRRESP